MSWRATGGPVSRDEMPGTSDGEATSSGDGRSRLVRGSIDAVGLPLAIGRRTRCFADRGAIARALTGDVRGTLNGEGLPLEPIECADASKWKPPPRIKLSVQIFPEKALAAAGYSRRRNHAFTLRRTHLPIVQVAPDNERIRSGVT